MTQGKMSSASSDQRFFGPESDHVPIDNVQPYEDDLKLFCVTPRLKKSLPVHQLIIEVQKLGVYQ
jgi:hypothetical protein